MKHTIKLLALAILFAFKASAQDIITKTNGDEVMCHVTKITAKNIKYRGTGADTSIASIPKKQVFSIKYENGMKEMFNETHVDDADPDGHWDKRSMADQGKADADQYYHKYHGARAAASISTVFTGAILGLIPTIACASTPPKDKRLGYPDAGLMKNKEYADAYKREAHHIKKKKVWGGYVTGVVIDVVCGVIWVAI